MLIQKIYSLLAISLLLQQTAQSQYKPIYPQSQQQADLNTQQKLPEKAKAKYNYLAPSRESLTPAFVDSLCAWALLDSAGNELLMPRYSELQLHGGGLVSATRAGRQSYWLHKSPKLIPLQYETVSWWAEEQLFVSANQQKGIINTAGRGIVPTMYDEIVALPQSILARRGKTWIRLNPKSGAPLQLNERLSPQAEATSQYARQFPLQIHTIAWKDNNSYQLIKYNSESPNTTVLIAPQKYPIHYSSGQFAFLEIEAVFYPYDLNSQSQKNIRYDKIIALNAQGLWAVGQIRNQENTPTTKWGIIDDKGNSLVDIQYDSLLIDKQFPTLVHLAQNNNNLTKWGLWDATSQTWLAKISSEQVSSEQKIIALAADIWAAPNPAATAPTPNSLYLWQKDSKGQTHKIKAFESKSFESKAFESVRYLSPQYFAAKETNKEGWQLYSLDSGAKSPAKNLLVQPYADIRSQKNQLFEVSSDGKSYFFISLEGKKPACP